MHDASVVDAITFSARVEARAAFLRFAAIADLVALRVDDQGERVWWACDGWDAACAEVGAALGIGAREASGQMATAVALRFRLPRVAAVFAAGEVSARIVALICWRTRLVEDPDILALLDAALSGALCEWAGLSRKKIERAIDGWVHKFDPAAVLKVRSAARGRGVGVGKPDDDTGVASIWGALLATDAELFDRALTALALQVCEHDPRTLAQRRADLGIAAALAQQAAQVVAARGKQAHEQLALGGQARAVAVAAEGLRDTADHAHFAAAVAVNVTAVPQSSIAVHIAAHAPGPGVDTPEDLERVRAIFAAT